MGRASPAEARMVAIPAGRRAPNLHATRGPSRDLHECAGAQQRMLDCRDCLRTAPGKFLLGRYAWRLSGWVPLATLFAANP